MQHHHVEPPVDGVGNRKIEEKYRFARPGYDIVIQKLAFALARPAFPEQIQHGTIPMNGRDLHGPAPDGSTSAKVV
jgi:hypothetical protein